jgi:release factor glutamine methyltransferase
MNRAGGMTILGLLRDAAAHLSDIDAGNPRLEAEYLLALALGIERPVLLARDPGVPVEPYAQTRFGVLLARRLAREPLQYVLGTVPFAGLDLVIGPGALIPRGETEVLVEQVASALRFASSAGSPASPSASREQSRAPLLIDVGTGSGAIVLALLHLLPGWRGIGVDRSRAALSWAQRNRAIVGERRCDLFRGDLLTSIRPTVADAVVSNPPYVRSAEIPGLAPEILEHEPHEALDGGVDGLEPFRRLVVEATRVLRPGGLLAVELAPDEPEQAAELLAASGAFHPAWTFLDLAGRKRGLLARRV